MTPTKSPYAHGFDDAVDATRAVIRASIHALATRPCSSRHHRTLMLEAIQAIYLEIEGLRTDAPDPDVPTPGMGLRTDIAGSGGGGIMSDRAGPDNSTVSQA